MKLSPPAILILTMFGSFVIILTAMIVILRLQSRPAPRRPQSVRQEVARSAPPDTVVEKQDSQPQPETKTAQADTPRVPQPSPPGALPPGVSAESRKFQQKLQQERKEMALLRAEMERRLKEELNLRGKKLDQFARQCEKLEPGEAVQILIELDDATIGEVLRRMDRDPAVKIAALLKRLGREEAISIK